MQGPHANTTYFVGTQRCTSSSTYYVPYTVQCLSVICLRPSKLNQNLTQNLTQKT